SARWPGRRSPAALSCRSRASALGKAAPENPFGDAVLEDLDRAAGDHPAAAAAHAVFDQLFLAVAEAAHHLQRLVRHVEPGAVAVGLGDRGLLWRLKAAVGVGGSAVQQELRGVELHLHVGELPLQALELGEQLAELLALERPAARALEGVAAERERARGVADALDVEAADLLLETAFLEQHHVGWDVNVVEVQLGPLFAGHEGGGLTPPDAWDRLLDENGTDAADAGTEANVGEDHIGIRRVRGEDLLAVDEVAIAVS